jgi:hypothetical protein
MTLAKTFLLQHENAEARTDTVIWTPESALGSSSGAREEEEKGGPEDYHTATGEPPAWW